MADDNEPVDLKPLSKLPKWIKWTQQWIESVDIDSIQYDQTRIAVHYKNDQQGTISLYHNGTSYHGDFILDPTNLRLNFNSNVSSHDANITGTLSVHIPNQTVAADVILKLPDTPLINLQVYSTLESLHTKLSTQGPLSTLEPLVDYLGVDQETRPWITTYAKGKSFYLDKFDANILYDSDKQVMEQINATAHVNNAEYTFDTALEPIKAPRVDLQFSNGKLFITPHSGVFYNLATEKSTLYIDFMPEHTMLHAHILTKDGKLNTPILKMLEHYKITIPIEQLKGTCDVDLLLGIDLNTYDTTAKGTFRPTASQLLLNGFTFVSNGGVVTLDTTKVSFSGFDTYYKNMIRASVNGQYDAIKESGNVNITPHYLTPTGNQKEISLQTANGNVKINYILSPKGDRIDITPSSWNVYGDTIEFAGISAAYDYANSILKLSQLPFSLSNKIKGNLSGVLGAGRTNLLLRMDLLDYKGVKMMRTPFQARLTKEANSSLELNVPKSSYWNFGGQTITLSPLKAIMSKNDFIFNNMKIEANRQFVSTLSGSYTFDSGKGKFIINQFNPTNPKLKPYIDMIDHEQFTFMSGNDSFVLHSDLLGIDLESITDGWKMKINDISTISKKSPILRQYEITNGRLNIYYLPKNERYTFDGEIIYPYKIMMTGDESMGRYRFSGSSQDGRSVIRINDRLMIHYGDTIDIRANNMGINLPEMYRWISNKDKDNTNPTDNEEDTSDKKITLNVTNGYLFLMKNRKILVDTLMAKLSDNIIEGRMSHDQGSADFTIVKDMFYIDGNHFNDRFMENLFAFSDFYGGEFSFKAQGASGAISGIMKIDNTILKEYRLLNNVLSFINTVPSLATFSLPNYNTKGLPVKEAYAHFTYQNQHIDLDNMVINSPEIKLVGNTKGNLANDTINGEITLKTDLGSSLSKVPVVGYILFGEDGSLSTTLKISGKLSDPTVETSIAKEVGIAPFNILKRTVTYPFKWLIDDKKKK